MKHSPIEAPRPLPCAATLSFDAAWALLAAVAAPLGAESVPLAKAGRRVLAEPVLAAMDIPSRDVAAMDGFAVRDADLAAGRRGFRLVGAAYPGAPFDGAVAPGEAARIMTGAAMPAGADRVLTRESVAARADAITFDGPPPGKTHVRRRGSDMRAGAVMLPAGRLLDPRGLVVAAAADAARVTVWRRPRVAVIATGDELAPPGEARAAGAVPDSLSEAILLLARQWGAAPLGATLVRDDEAAITARAARALDEADVLVMLGGASRGDRDFARAALGPLGLAPLFADVAIRPGKPVWCGRIGARLVLGLPGNPTAAMTVARLFLAPMLTALGGRGAAAALRWERSRLVEPLGPCGDREAFLCGEAAGDGVRLLGRQEASGQAMLARAELLARIPPGTTGLARGAGVETLRF